MQSSSSNFSDFVAASDYVLLPGGVGTTLQIKGYELRPESWSGEANLSVPHLVEDVHRDFLAAGARIISTNTFRTHGRFMERALAQSGGYADRLLKRYGIDPATDAPSQALSYHASKRAVDSALRVKTDSEEPVYVAGSFGPLNDTHSHDPEKAIGLEELRAGHKQYAQLLKELGVDVLFPETIPTRDEAIAMAEAASATGLDFVVSFVLDPKTGRLFDGTSIEEAVEATDLPGRAGIMFNCTPLATINEALPKLLDCYDGYVGAYPNGFGSPAVDGAHWNHDHAADSIDSFVETVSGWMALSDRVKFVGGCCGASPAYIEALNMALQDEAPLRRYEPARRGPHATGSTYAGESASYG